MLGVGAIGVGLAGQAYRERHGWVGLLSETVAISGDGQRHLLHAADLPRLRPGSRCLDTASMLVRAAERRHLDALPDWVHRGGEHQDLLISALLDLWVLSEGLPASVAAWSPYWRFVWARDAAHVAVAFAAIGQLDRALAQLVFLARVQEESGWFAPRYDPWTEAPPDNRTRQLDSTAWVVWAADRLCALHPDETDRIHHISGRMVRRSTALLASLLDDSGLPPATPDYWEVKAPALSLGIAAPVVAALDAAARLGDVWTDRRLADLAGEAGARCRAEVTRSYEPRGWPRYLGGRGLDASMTFMAPPYQATTPPGLSAALDRYRRLARRPAGGVAPGSTWRNDGISWTPATAVLAQAYAHTGRAGSARTLLTWLENHRTAAGSLPEKVLHNGEPAAVAPLAWTAAVVVTTIGHLRSRPD